MKKKKKRHRKTVTLPLPFYQAGIPGSTHVLSADRANRALVYCFLNAGSVRVGPGFYLRYSICSHLEHIGADLRAQSATDTEILIHFWVSHAILLNP